MTISRISALNSVTPGHPEYGITPASSPQPSRLAKAGQQRRHGHRSRWLSEHYNKPGLRVFDYDVYVICSDGDMMEGVASEAASIAGHLGLDNLCWIYDDNTITIEGHTELAFSEDVETRFRGYKWNVLHVTDANDRAAVTKALEQFKATEELADPDHRQQHHRLWRAGQAKHRRRAQRRARCRGSAQDQALLGWPERRQFLVPDGVYNIFQNGICKRGAGLNAAWKKTFADYAKANAKSANEILRNLKHELPVGWDADLPDFKPDEKGVATRDATGKVFKAMRQMAWVLGGAADLVTSADPT